MPDPTLADVEGAWRHLGEMFQETKRVVPGDWYDLTDHTGYVGRFSAKEIVSLARIQGFTPGYSPQEGSGEGGS